MTTIKSYTDISQSKRLVEILPPESADMWWLYVTAQGKYIAMMSEEPDPHYITRMKSYGIKDAAIRCWSLAALLDVCPMVVGRDMDMYCCWHNRKNLCTRHYDNPIDACYEMIIKLHESNLL